MNIINVTIILPVFKDFPSLKKCLQSLKKFVDPRHKILLVNDCSPETSMEEDILKEIIQDARFNYYKNNQNLGFVRTCNKAVQELDQSNNDILLLNSDTEVTEKFLEEMVEVLYDCEKHGIVCPRSNNATILSIPLNYDEDRSKIINESYACYLEIKDLLPKYNIIPTAVGFCMLIKRELIERYGLFDERYSPGYNEENDFAMRINRYGYSSIMANHAFVFHHETKSFTVQEKNELRKKNQKILLEKYPYYLDLISNYLNYQVNPVDHFSDVISNTFFKKPRILFSLYNLPALHNGTSEYGLNLLNNFVEKYHDKYDIDILTNTAGAEFHKLSEQYSNIFYPETIFKHYHLTICPSQIFDLKHLLILNKFSLRILVTMQDIISLRCRYLYIEDPDAENLFALTLTLSDGIIALTKASQKDMLKYFEPFPVNNNKKINIKVIPQGISNEVHDFEKYKHEIPFEKYVLIVGNEYHDHKSVKECIHHLQNMEIDFCVLGCGDMGRQNVKCYPSGFLDEVFINAMYHYADLVIFPSTYEGYGLPVIKSIFYGKKIVVLDNEINKEISAEYGKENFLFFKTYNEIKEHILNNKKQLLGKKNKVRSWEDVADDTEKFIEDILRAHLNAKELGERWYSLQSLTQTIAASDGRITELMSSTSWQITLPLRMIGYQLKRFKHVVELAKPAVQRGGGVAKTIKKAIRLYCHEGIPGIKRGFRLLSASQLQNNYKDIDEAYLKALSCPAEELLASRVLIIAEMSIPQCKKYRVEQKQDLFQYLGIDCTILDWTDVQACINALQTHSLVIFYRVPASPLVTSVINEAKRLRLATIWEVDDLIFDKQILMKSKTILALDKKIIDQLIDGADLYKKAMLLCDRGIASTTGLSDAMKKAGLPEVYIIENALDQQTMEIARKVCCVRDFDRNGVVRIVYGSGTNTHDIDFQEAAPAIIKILNKFPNVRLRIIGQLDLPEIFSRYKGQVERFPNCNYNEYLATLAECEISITPLENFIFNDSKSNIKYLEASMVKVPSVCSPRAAFTQVISHEKNGFLCETDAEWEAALTLLVISPKKRKEIGEAAHASVMQRYLPENIARQQVAPLFAQSERKPDTLQILSVNCYYFPRSYGGSTIVAEEVNKLINGQEGFQVHVFTTLPSSVVPPYAVRRYEAEGINVYGVGLPKGLDEKTQFENHEIDSAFANVLAVVKPDVVHFHCIQGIGVSVLDLCVRRNIKYVITLHDAWWLCGRQFMINKQNKYCGQKKIDLAACSTCVDNHHSNVYRSKRLNATLHNASLLITPSRFFADFYISNGFHHTLVNKNGVRKPLNAKRFRREGPLRFGYVGGNTKIKGFHLIRKVFSDFANPNVKLVLVDNMLNLGFASYHQEDLAGIPNAEIVPAYTQNNIENFFANIDVLLFPTQWKESFGLTVREALARNVWVIATDAGGVVEDIRQGQNGCIVPFGDMGEGLKQAVIDTIRHFENIKPGEEVSLGTKDITFFEDQATDLAAMLKKVAADNYRDIR